MINSGHALPSHILRSGSNNINFPPANTVWTAGGIFQL